jgi:hypothetical protein
MLELVRTGLATATPERVVGGETVEIARVRITGADAGRAQPLIS